MMLLDFVVLSYGPVQAILTSELSMRHVSVKFVPYQLIPEQKVCQDFHQRPSDDPSSMSWIITSDGGLVYGYNTDEAAVVTMEEAFISAIKEGATEPQINQEQVHVLFFDVLSIREFDLQANPSIESSTATF